MPIGKLRPTRVLENVPSNPFVIRILYSAHDAERERQRDGYAASWSYVVGSIRIPRPTVSAMQVPLPTICLEPNIS
jgi:hypothetical protein